MDVKRVRQSFDESSMINADISGIMEFIEHISEGGKAVEIRSDQILIKSEQDALDLIADIGYLYESHKMILCRENLGADFFDLSSGMAGGILQKFSNYRVRLVVVGDFSAQGNQRLEEFIMESNKGRQVNFVADLAQALEVLHG
jgi:hypothetical protein